MSKRNEFIESVEISQVENGYILLRGSMCGKDPREKLVFQSWAELAEYLNDHFTFRNDNLNEDSYSSSNN